MPYVFIIHSSLEDLFYVGSCLDLKKRLIEHNEHKYEKSFTKRAKDWTVYWELKLDDMTAVRKIESHIKNMKSRTYYKNLRDFPEITEKLIEKFKAGSCR